MLEQTRKARKILATHLQTTPLVASAELSAHFQTPIYLKLELVHPTRSFKVRPAFHSILAQLEACRDKGVLTTSSGNFAQAVAYAAKTLGIHATIVMTDDANPLKIENTRALGAEVVFCGTTFESRFAKVAEISAQRGSVVIHPFDSIETILGDATLALELLEQLPAQPLSVLCPVSGGGLITGIASVLTAENSHHRVYAAQPSAGGAFTRSLREGSEISTPKVISCADALTATRPGKLAFELSRTRVAGGYLIEEKEILQATRDLHALNVATEPGGAISVSALPHFLREHKPAGPVVCIVSGGNIDPKLKL